MIGPLARWRLLAVVLVILGLVGAGLVEARKRKQHREVLRRIEQIKAEAEGLIVARDAALDDLERAADKNDVLRQEIERIREALPESDVEVREVVRWRTREVPVEIERLIGPAFGELSFSPGCKSQCEGVLDDLVDKFPFTFAVSGETARLETRVGNWFAVGVVDVWRIQPYPSELLFSEPWEVELTDYQRTPTEGPRLRRNAILAGLTSSPGVTAKYARTLGKRWEAFGGVTYLLDPERLESSVMHCGPPNYDLNVPGKCTTATRSVEEDRWQIEAGIGMRF